MHNGLSMKYCAEGMKCRICSHVQMVLFQSEEPFHHKRCRSGCAPTENAPEHDRTRPHIHIQYPHAEHLLVTYSTPRNTRSRHKLPPGQSNILLGLSTRRQSESWIWLFNEFYW